MTGQQPFSYAGLRIGNIGFLRRKLKGTRPVCDATVVTSRQCVNAQVRVTKVLADHDSLLKYISNLLSTLYMTVNIIGSSQKIL